MTLLELPMILLYVRMTSSFPTRDLVTDSQGEAIWSFLHLKYIKVRFLGTLLYFIWLITARFNPDSRGMSVAHIGKVVSSPNESVSRDSNTRSHPYGGCSPLTSSTNYPIYLSKVPRDPTLICKVY